MAPTDRPGDFTYCGHDKEVRGMLAIELFAATAAEALIVGQPFIPDLDAEQEAASMQTRADAAYRYADALMAALRQPNRADTRYAYPSEKGMCKGLRRREALALQMMRGLILRGEQHGERLGHVETARQAVLHAEALISVGAARPA